MYDDNTKITEFSENLIVLHRAVYLFG